MPSEEGTWKGSEAWQAFPAGILVDTRKPALVAWWPFSKNAVMWDDAATLYRLYP